MAKDDFARSMMGAEVPVSTSRLGRLLKTGRSAYGLASAMLGKRDAEVDVAAVERLVRGVGELKGVSMKLGQILSFVDPSLSPELRGLLSLLQRQAPASDPAAIRQTLKDAFGARADVLLAEFQVQPFAVASIGQVHRARLPGVGEVVVKVRHPGIERAFQVDFSSALGGVSMVNALLLGAAADAKAMVDEGRATMLAECDFAREATHQRAFRTWLREDDTLVVPEVIDAWSSTAVLTTRWEPGLSLEAFLAAGPSQAERDRAAAALFRVYIGGFYGLGLLHADPHPGNFAFRDGKVVLYDFGCVRPFNAPITTAFADLALALRRKDRPAVLDAARRFGFRVSNPEQEALLERFARSFFAPMLVEGASTIAPDEAVEAKQLMRDKHALMKLGLPAHLLFLLRLRFGLYAVLSQVGARLDWGTMERQMSLAGWGRPCRPPEITDTQA